MSKKVNTPNKKIFCFLDFTLSLVALAAMVLFLLPGPVSAALVKQTDQISNESVYNPKPDQYDISLPMPCGLSMVFRLVAIPISGKLRDMKTFLGSDDDSDYGYLDRRHLAYLGSPLSVDNLPEPQREIARAFLGNLISDQVYLMGKYEVTKAQWDSVMSGTCSEITQESARPQADISWYETMNFTAKYMQWLLAEHPETLPAFEAQSEAIGLVRLPTEDEWEYAAMGGQFISSDALRTNTFFEMEDGRQERDYGLFQTPSRNPESESGAIGRWRPNPLGLFDTAGNVAEMTFSPFRMTVEGRLHGSVGGFVRKGGGYLDAITLVRPGKRTETAFFYAQGPTSAIDLGFRLVVSAVNTAGVERVAALRGEWEKIVPPAPAQVEPAQTDEQLSLSVNVEGLSTLQKVDALIKATSDPELREHYASLRSEITDATLVSAWQNEDLIRDSLRRLIYGVYAIYTTDSRISSLRKSYQDIQSEVQRYQHLLNEASAQERAELEKVIAENNKRMSNFSGQIMEFDENIANLFNYYLFLLEDLKKFDSQDKQKVNSIMLFLKQDIKGDNLYSQAIFNAYRQVSRDIGKMRVGQVSEINLKNLLDNAK